MVQLRIQRFKKRRNFNAAKAQKEFTKNETALAKNNDIRWRLYKLSPSDIKKVNLAFPCKTDEFQN